MTVPFAFNNGGAYFHGDTAGETDICGYQRSCSRDTHCHWEGDMNLWLVSPDLVEATMHECGAMNALERLDIRPGTRRFVSMASIQQQFERSLGGAVKTEAQILSMMVTLLEGGTEPLPWEQELQERADAAAVCAAGS